MIDALCAFTGFDEANVWCIKYRWGNKELL